MREIGQSRDSKIDLFVLCLCLLCLTLCFGTAVVAEDAHPCADDIAKFCKDLKPAGGRLLTCLQDRVSDLPATCRKKLEESKQRLKEAQPDCEEDVEKLCKDVQLGAGRLAKCLRDHATELSSMCKQKIEKTKQKKQENQDLE